EQVDKLFADSVDRETLYKAERGEFPTALWQEFLDLGVTYALVSEESGGAGLSFAELGGLFQVLGYRAAPIPAGEAIIAAWALAQAGIDLPEGMVLPVPEELKLAGGGTSVTGRSAAIGWADSATHFVAA